MEEKNLTAKEELEKIETRRKELQERVAEEKREEKAKKSKERETRDLILGIREEILSDVQKNIFEYRKLGKKAKYDVDIFEEILTAIQDSAKPSQEDIAGVNHPSELGQI